MESIIYKVPEYWLSGRRQRIYVLFKSKFTKLGKENFKKYLVRRIKKNIKIIVKINKIT